MLEYREEICQEFKLGKSEEYTCIINHKHNHKGRIVSHALDDY